MSKRQATLLNCSQVGLFQSTLQGITCTRQQRKPSWMRFSQFIQSRSRRLVACLGARGCSTTDPIVRLFCIPFLLQMQTNEMQHVPHVSGYLRQLIAIDWVRKVGVLGSGRWKLSIEILYACIRIANDERDAFNDY